MGLLDDARQFFTREAGQERRKWLDENLQEAGGLLDYYLGPTGVPDKLQAAGGLLNYTDAGDMTEAADASREFWNDPSFRGGVRLGTAGAAMAIPFVGARMLNDGVDVVGDALRSGGDDVIRFAADESGAVGPGGGLPPAQQQAQDVLDLLRSGRGADVTDDMLAAADDMYLFDNYDLPMDVQSRMRRAEEMGADPLLDYYHGTAREGFVDTTDIVGFEPERVGDRWNADSRGFSMSSSKQDANYYAQRSDSSKGDLGDGMVYPLVDTSKKPMRLRPKDQYSGTIGTWDERPPDTYDRLDAGGYDAVDIYSDGVSMRVSMDPSNIRSRFARFDPRLAHLRNLSAGIGGAAMLRANQDDDDRPRNYLRMQ